MELGRILDSTPEPPSLAHPLDFFTNGLQPPAENTDGDYCLPVPMTEFQRQLNDEVVSLHHSDILKFYSNGGTQTNNRDLTHSLQSLYTNSQLVATHPYLLVDHYLPPNLLLKDIPNRLSRASGKFTMLINIVELVRDKQMEIALISRPGKSFDLIEALLLGKMINYKRHSGSYLRASHKFNKKYSTIHLIPSSQLDSTYFGTDRFDLIIALDQTFKSTDPHIETIRSQSRTTTADSNGTAPKLAPIIRLVPYYSAEHVAFKFRKNVYDEALYMRNVIAAIVVLRGRVGTIPVDLRPFYAQGLQFLAPWIANMRSVWPLPPIPEIEVYSAYDVEKALLTDSATSVSTKLEISTETPTGNGEKCSDDAKDSSIPTESHHNNIGTGVKDLFSDDDDYYRAKRIKRETYSPGVPETSYSFLAPPTGSLHRPLDDRQVLTDKILRRLENAMQDLEVKDTELQSLRSIASTQQTAQEELVDEMSSFVNKITQLNEKIRIYERKAERHDSDMKRMKEQLDNQTAELLEVRNLLLAKEEQDEVLAGQEQESKKIINSADKHDGVKIGEDANLIAVDSDGKDKLQDSAEKEEETESKSLDGNVTSNGNDEKMGLTEVGETPNTPGVDKKLETNEVYRKIEPAEIEEKSQVPNVNKKLEVSEVDDKLEATKVLEKLEPIGVDENLNSSQVDGKLESNESNGRAQSEDSEGGIESNDIEMKEDSPKDNGKDKNVDDKDIDGETECHDIEMKDESPTDDEKAGKVEPKEIEESETNYKIDSVKKSKKINFADAETQLKQIAKLETELKEETEKIKARTTENEYMHVEYQKASSAATESAEEVETLKRLKSALEAKLNTDIVTMKQLAFNEERKMKDLYIFELETKLVNVEEHIKRLMENEKQQQSRSRYGMRSSSTAPRRTKSPSVSNSRRSSPSDREGNGGTTNNGPHPLQNMTNSS